MGSNTTTRASGTEDTAALWRGRMTDEARPFFDEMRSAAGSLNIDAIERRAAAEGVIVGEDDDASPTKEQVINLAALSVAMGLRVEDRVGGPFRLCSSK